ncbi:MAG: Gfo/Idh/MocA family oxidoreductase [Ruminococcaceae bacterium]|nr:Gfo/Idh/MocA family oxidoreductase [Oscillospiraceae bacterium]
MINLSKFRWAYVGSGNIAKSTARSITKGEHCITAVYSRNSQKAESFASKYKAKPFTDFESMLKSDCFDGVYIATPHTSHLEYSVKALKAGKPVLCEKPVGVSTAEVDLMINASRENKTYFCEAMWTWFSPVALTVKKWIDEKRLGEITDVHIDYAFPGLMMNKNSRVLTPETAGGALLDIGIYPITYCYRLFGFPKTITCNGTLKNGIDIAETVVLGYDGFNCTLEMSLSSLKEGCVISGTKGKINIPMFHMAGFASLKTEDGRETFKGKTDYLNEFTLVAEEIRVGKTESEFIPFGSTRDCMKIMDECRKQMNLVYPFEK